ncbi:MAG: hypothetical protein WD847_09240 [Pirellulales bacterium]
MQFRSGQLDDRRRRVLTDEVIGSSVAAGEPSSAGRGSAGSGGARLRRTHHSRTYSEAAMERQPRITDLIPRKHTTFVLLFLASLTVVAGLEALYAWMPTVAHMSTDGRVAAFDLDGEGGLCCWFSSLTLALASLVALLVYTIRRHKSDDYHGRYRIWLWAALCWMTMSMDEGGSLHEGFKEMMAHLTGRRVFGDGSIWWVGPYLVVLGVVGIRLLLDMRPCRSSVAAFLATACCYATAVLAQLEIVMAESGARGIMLEEGCEMVGNLCLVLAMALHARYVILDAQGLIPVREKPKQQKVGAVKSGEPAPTRSWFRKPKVDAAHAAPPKPARRGDLVPAVEPARPATNRSAAGDADEDYGYDFDEPPARVQRKVSSSHREELDATDRKLSKAERKALRRQRRQ